MSFGWGNMKLLLDTQIFIWWDSESNKLPPHLLQLCEDETNSLLLSVASVWEIQIKVQKVGEKTIALKQETRMRLLNIDFLKKQK